RHHVQLKPNSGDLLVPSLADSSLIQLPLARNDMVQKRNLRESKVDRISNLPAHVIQLILTSLPIKEAGRTSLLSREWRHHWRNVTRLVFDRRFNSSSTLNTNEVITRIQEALQVHDGPITEFELSIAGLTPYANIDHLMAHLSNKAILELSLKFRPECCYTDEIRCPLFFAFQLDSLILRECRFTVPSWFVGFNRLIVLELETVSLPDDFFRSFLLKCPLLEDLRVSFVEGPRKLEVVGAPRLKVFILRAYGLKNISFKCTPLLSVVSIQVEEMLPLSETDISTVDMFSVFAALPALQHLNLSLECLKILAAGPVPGRLSDVLHGLEVLDIRKCYDDCDGEFDIVRDDDHLSQLKVLLCLIRSSPNLYKFRINMETCSLEGLTFERESVQLESETDCYPDPKAEDSYCPRLWEVNMGEV
ncbi:unnamed protein product, partial [Linum tenue]